MKYQIQKGDNLYEIAKKYRISVDDIMKSNRNLNPYNLMIGSYIYIPLGEKYPHDYHLKEDMRQVWEQHVFWTRLLIVSITERLKDENFTTKRLLKNPEDLANIFRPYYGNDVASVVLQLITEHLVVGANLIHAIANNSVDEIKRLNNDWYKNADLISKTLSNINPYYNVDILRGMLYKHLDLTKEEVTHRIQGDYRKEIEVFDAVEKEAILMADYFTQGIYKQFN